MFRRRHDARNRFSDTSRQHILSSFSFHIWTTNNCFILEHDSSALNCYTISIFQSFCQKSTVWLSLSSVPDWVQLLLQTWTRYLVLLAGRAGRTHINRPLLWHETITVFVTLLKILASKYFLSHIHVSWGPDGCATFIFPYPGRL